MRGAGQDARQKGGSDQAVLCGEAGGLCAIGRKWVSLSLSDEEHCHILSAQMHRRYARRLRRDETVRGRGRLRGRCSGW
jgi:hypothetical protein